MVAGGRRFGAKKLSSSRDRDVMDYDLGHETAEKGCPASRGRQSLLSYSETPCAWAGSLMPGKLAMHGRERTAVRDRHAESNLAE